MAPLVPSAKVTLEYPLYGCDFDPQDSSRLIVGGGGGAGRTGVGNKITVLDASNPNKIGQTCDVDLSKDEDNVTSLAAGQDGMVFAGVNSSPKDVEKGTNSHFRVLRMASTGKGKGGEKKAGAQDTSGKILEFIDHYEDATKIEEVSRVSLFKGTEKDTYQRITRLSKPYPKQPQLGAVATGLSKQSEIVFFDTSATSRPVVRGGITPRNEAVDMDFIQTDDDDYLFAYCDEHDIYLTKMSSMTAETEPERVYITPGSEGREVVGQRKYEKPTVPSFRAMRFLTKDFFMMLTNIHSQGGVVLQIFRIPPSGKGQCRIAQSLRLPERLTKATGLAVSNLTPPIAPSSTQGYTQFVVAVAGHDISISLFKVDLQHESGVSMITKIKPFRTFKNVHPLQITGLAFSNFTPPTHPVTASTPPQTLKLASVGVSNTVVVHTLPLFPVPLSVKRGQSKTPRYVIALPSTKAALGVAIILSMIGVVFFSMLIQGFLEIRGGVPVYLDARKHVPLRVQEALGRPYEFPSDYRAVPTDTTPAAAILTPTSHHNHRIGVPLDPAEDGSALRLPDFFEQNPAATLLMQSSDDGVKPHLHDPEIHRPHGGKTWDDLGHGQRDLWKKKMIEAGHWAEDMGETILKGVIFGELAGTVGHAVAGN